MQEVNSQDFLQRLSRIEGRLEEDERSIAKRLSLWGGLVALVVSIMIGGFQIYEYTILRQREAREASIIQLGTFVRRITQLNSEIARSALLAENPREKAIVNAEAKIINSEKLSIVRLADRLLQEAPEAAGFATYATIAYEMLAQGNNDKALSYATTALEASQTTPEKAEALRYIARVLFAPGDTQDIEMARQKFEEVRQFAQTETSYLRSQLVANAISDLVIAEVFYGDCDRAVSAIQSLKQDMSTESSPLLLQLALGEIGNLLQGNNRCPMLL